MYSYKTCITCQALIFILLINILTCSRVIKCETTGTNILSYLNVPVSKSSAFRVCVLL